jgi:demethylmenaquinone methyltransferase/2-methoxy-6-polyprenyl-1,4-benzoquinol methylase
LMRNVIDIHKVLVESYRLLKPGGRMVVLDTTRSPRTPLSPLISIYLHDIIPLLGGLIAGDWMAYTYLPDSMKGFLMAEQLAGELQKAGFLEVGFRRLMLGIVAIHWGHKIDNHTKG